MAGGQVKKLIFYNLSTGTNADLTVDLNAIVTANAAKIIDIAPYIGGCETDAQADGSAAADDAILQVAVAQGQTFAVGTGTNGGANECGNLTNTPLWPASSQYVIAVSSTMLGTSTTDSWLSEQVYNATGGSPSTFEPMPAWQTTFGVPGTTRATADVAFDGYPGSGSTSGSGTALSAALFTGVWARVLEANGSGFGFAGPVIYALPAADFHDITLGNNDGGRPALGYVAGPGYDFPSGRGSMIIGKVIADSVGLGNQPPVANFTFVIDANTLSANFTDTSTDADGTIATHSWDFGDGTTSTEANPTHTFAVSGAHIVTERVTDNDGAVSGNTQTLDVGPTQLLQNPGFETGDLPPWVCKDPNNVSCFVGSHYEYDGKYMVLFYSDNTDLYQRVTIPPYMTSASLSLYLWVSVSGAPTTKVDTLKVQVTSTDGQILATLATFTNLDGASNCNEICPPVYVLHTYDMTPFIGQTVNVRFYGPTTSYTTYQVTAFFLDDVTLNVQ